MKRKIGEGTRYREEGRLKEMRKLYAFLALLPLALGGCMVSVAELYKVLLAPPPEYVNYAFFGNGAKVTSSSGNEMIWGPVKQVIDGNRENPIHDSVKSYIETNLRNRSRRARDFSQGWGGWESDPRRARELAARAEREQLQPRPDPFQTWIEVELKEPKKINRVLVFVPVIVVSPDVIPAVTDCRLEYFESSGTEGEWKTVGVVERNKNRVIEFNFKPIVTKKIRICVPDQHSQISEIEVYGDEVVKKSR
jgi:hypothetical protein